MKKIVITMLLGLTLLVPAIQHCSNGDSEREHLQNLAEVINIKRSKDLVPVRIFGIVTALIGGGMLLPSAKYLYQNVKELLTLWKKFENKEDTDVNWRKLPRHALLSFLAAHGTLFGLSITLIGVLVFSETFRSRTIL